MQDLLKKLQEESSLPYNFAEEALYLDPDIIDLTMIPPPITPDEVSSLSIHQHICIAREVNIYYNLDRPQGKESTEVRITQNKRKERENSYQK